MERYNYVAGMGKTQVLMPSQVLQQIYTLPVIQRACTAALTGFLYKGHQVRARGYYCVKFRRSFIVGKFIFHDGTVTVL